MRLTEFGKAIGKGTGSRSGADFLKECVWAKADFASDCMHSRIIPDLFTYFHSSKRLRGQKMYWLNYQQALQIPCSSSELRGRRMVSIHKLNKLSQ
jgi:hypothetical protein